MFCFVFSYALQNVWVAIDVYIGNKDHFYDVFLGSLLFPLMCNFIPILLVLYGHFRNITSLARILKFSWSSRSRPSDYSTNSVFDT